MPSTITFDDNSNYFSAMCGLCKKMKIELNKVQDLSNKIFSFTSTITFDDNSNYFSAMCGLCKKTKIELNKVQDLSNKIFSCNDLTSTFGADLEMVANVMGLTGPNGLYFCPFC